MPGLSYGILSQKSPDYCGDIWSELQDLYEGGYSVAAHASRYLDRLEGESEKRYQDRCKSAAYLGYLGQIIDYFAAALFTQELAVVSAADDKNTSTPGGVPDQKFYPAFATNADLRGTSFAKLLKAAFTTAILKRKCLLAVDFPRNDQAARAQNLADEDAVGARRAYAFEVPVEQLIDWQYDDVGNFRWAILNRCRQERTSPAGTRDLVTEEFKVWTAADNGGPVSWERYEISYKKDAPPKPDDLPTLVDPGGTSSFTCIPLVEMCVPAGLWAGNKLGCIAKEHFQRRSALISGANKSLVGIPTVFKGPEVGPMGGAVPAEIQRNPNRGRDPGGTYAARGYVELGSDDRFEFVEPKGVAFQLTKDELASLKDEMFRIVHQMAASVTNNSVSLGRSGLSKQKDGEATAIVLGAFGSLVRDYSKKIYAVISTARGESVIWTPHGLDNYVTEDRADLISEAVQIDMMSIPSQTWQANNKFSVAMKLTPNLPPDTQEVIRKEIQAGVSLEQDMKDLMRDAQADALANPVPPAQANGSAPPTKTGKAATTGNAPNAAANAS